MATNNIVATSFHAFGSAVNEDSGLGVALGLVLRNTHATTTTEVRLRDGGTGGSVYWIHQVLAGTVLDVEFLYPKIAPSGLWYIDVTGGTPSGVVFGKVGTSVN